MKPGLAFSERIAFLREASYLAEPSISVERARILTDFYRKNEGKYPVPVLRALSFKELCTKQSIYIGDFELIVGERGPGPKAVPTYPELTCHSEQDLRILNTRERQRYAVSEEDIRIYKEEIIPFWKGKTLREQIFSVLPTDWKDMYESGLFTEFAEQRAPGHTALDGKIYKYGMKDFRRRIAGVLRALEGDEDPESIRK